MKPQDTHCGKREMIKVTYKQFATILLSNQLKNGQCCAMNHDDVKQIIVLDLFSADTMCSLHHFFF